MEALVNDVSKFLSIFNYVEIFSYFICTPICALLLLLSALGAISNFIDYRNTESSRTERRQLLINNCSQYSQLFVFISIIYISLVVLCRCICIFL